MLMRTTPFPSVAGSAVEKTAELYFCRACLRGDFADHVEATGRIYCAECDSEDVVELAVWQRQERKLQEREWEVLL